MGNKGVKFSVFIRSAWFVMAVFLVIFCGPVKKLVELRLYNGDNSFFIQSIENKLRTGYREKRDIVQLVQCVTHPNPDTGLSLFLTSMVFLSFLFLKKSINFKQRYSPAIIVPGISLYLRFRKLQV